MFFKSKKPTISRADQTAQDFVGVDEINDNFTYTKDRIVYAYISVRAMGDSLLSKNERNMGYTKLTRALEKEHNPWQLISIPRVINIQKMLNNLITLRKSTVDEARLRLLHGEIEATTAMAKNGVREPMLIIKMYEREDKGGERKLDQRIQDMIRSFTESGLVEARRLTNPDIAYLCKQFSELGLSHGTEEETFEAPTLDNQEPYNSTIDLINEITPIGGIDIKRNDVSFGGIKGKLYAVTGYSREVSNGWLTEIMNNTEAVTALSFDPTNPHVLAEALSRSVRREAGEALSVKDHRASKGAERRAKDADRLLTEIDENQEIIGKISIVTMPFSQDDENLTEVCERTERLFSKQKLKLRCIGQLQKEGLQAISPYHPVPAFIDQAFQRLMPLYTFVGGSPMCINSYQDEGGFYFAQTKTGNLVSIDNWYRGRDRTNSNFVILGKAGAGKSTLIKHIIQTEFMRGTKILVIDPESEYSEITAFLNGSVLYAGGGNSKINLLQVRSSPDDDEEEEKENQLYSSKEKGNQLAMHIKNMETIFRSYIGSSGLVDEKLFAILEKTLIELYAEFGIDWNTDCSTLKAKDFPIIEDLYERLETIGGKDEDYKDLAARLYSAAKGADSFIFNGHTNINLDNQIVTFDTNSLQNSDDKIKRTQYLNILHLCWERMSRSRDERVMLICDEAYLLVDQNLPQALMYLRNIEKRCRKFESLIGVATHSVVDLLSPAVRQYGQAILDIPTYKYFLAADGQNLKELTELYDLTEAQQNILRAGLRGEALGMLGSTKIHLLFELPQYKLDNMGKAGGK